MGKDGHIICTVRYFFISTMESLVVYLYIYSTMLFAVFVSNYKKHTLSTMYT